MSNPDSFINEVKQEVRRDRLYRIFRRYGWIGLLVVLAIVGGTAYREWSTANERSTAQNLGDAIKNASEASTPAERIAELDKIKADNADIGAIKELIAATELFDDGQETAAVDRLQRVARNQDVSVVYRDLASLKWVAIRRNSMEPGELVRELEPLTALDSPFRLLAIEMKAHAQIELENHAEAASLLRELIDDPSAPADLSRRASQLMLTLEAGS